MYNEGKVKVYRIKGVGSEQLVVTTDSTEIPPGMMLGTMHVEFVGDAILPNAYREVTNRRFRQRVDLDRKLSEEITKKNAELTSDILRVEKGEQTSLGGAQSYQKKSPLYFRRTG